MNQLDAKSPDESNGSASDSAGTASNQRATLSLSEAAELLGLSRKATRKAGKAGEIPAIQIGRRLLILREPLESLLTGQSPRPAEEWKPRRNP